MVTYGAYGQQLYNNGYSVIPIVPNDKWPAVSDWTEITEPLSFSDYPNCGIGFLCGTANKPVYAVDVDILDKEVVEYMHSVIPAAPYRIGRDPKRLYLFRSDEPGIPKVFSVKYKIGKVEILGRGQQFVAFGIHPETRHPYRWPDASPMARTYEQLPILNREDMYGIISSFNEYAEILGFEIEEKLDNFHDPNHIYEKDNPLFEKLPLGIPLPKLKKLVSTFDPDCTRITWLKIGFAIHHETSGDVSGFEIWDEWSAQGSKYQQGETEYCWGRFGTNNKEPTTAAYLLKEYKEKTGTQFDAGPVVEESNKSDPFSELPWSIDRFVDDPPVRQMVIEDMLPCGITTLLYSAGGVGKSTLSLYMAIKVAIANEIDVSFLGRKVNGGQVVVLTAEDPEEELNRRIVNLMKAVADELFIDYQTVKRIAVNNLFIVSTFGISAQLFVLKADKGILKTTVYYKSFLNNLKKINNLRLVFIDTKTRYSPGEGAGNVVATNEITYYEAICRLAGKPSVILLHHTSKKSRDGSQDGQQAYRDASASFDTVRVDWYLRRLTPRELARENISLTAAKRYYIFENAKNNYIMEHVDILIKRDGYSFTYKDIVETDSQDAKEQRKQEVIDAIVFYAQTLTTGAMIQADVIKVLQDEKKLSRAKVVAALKDACEDGLLEKVDRGDGKAKLYVLTEEGKKYKLIIE